MVLLQLAEGRHSHSRVVISAPRVIRGFPLALFLSVIKPYSPLFLYVSFSSPLAVFPHVLPHFRSTILHLFHSGVKSRIVTKATPSKEHATVSGEIPIINFSESVCGGHIQKSLRGLTVLLVSGQCLDINVALESK